MKSHCLILFTVKFSTVNMLRLAVALSVGGYMLTQLRCKQSLMEINSLETQMKKLEEEVAESRAKFKEVLQDIEKKLSEKLSESVTAENKENKELQRQMQKQICILKQRVAVLENTLKESSEKEFEVVEWIRVNQVLRDHEIRVLKKKLEACSQKPHQSKWKFCKIKHLVKWRYQLKH